MNKNLLLIIAFASSLLFTNSLKAQQCINLDAGDDVQMQCIDNNVVLDASYIGPAGYKETNVYEVADAGIICSSDYTGSRSYLQSDDVWSNLVIPLAGSGGVQANIPFKFCYFGNQYDQVLISSNGIVTFDLEPLGLFSSWVVDDGVQLPTQVWQTNAIYGVFHDMDLGVQPLEDRISYRTEGEAPNRVFIVSFEAYQFQCNDLLSKSQIRLYESSNVIDVIVEEKPICTTWNGGRAVVGIQNKSGTIGYAPPGRNNGVWTPAVGGEMWRFIPNGNDLPYTLTWLDDQGNILNANNETQITVAPQVETTYTVQMQLTGDCDGNISLISDDVIITPAFLPAIQDPVDLIQCENPIGSGTFDFDIDQTTFILNGLNPADYIITYHTSFADADTGANPIAVLNPYTSDNAIIYVRIEDINDSTCTTIREFKLIVQSSVFSYTPNSFCSTDINPTPDDGVFIGGDFSIDNGGVIDIVTGEINLVASGLGTDGTGVFTITYTVGPPCASSYTYDVSITLNPNIDSPVNTTEMACDSFTLPLITGTNLTGNEAYYTETGGTGTMYNAGDILNFDATATYPVTLYLYDETGTTPNCFDEQSFQLTINQTPIITPPTNETVCDNFTLPIIQGTGLSGNEAYYTGTGGTGTTYNAGDVFTFDPAETYPITLYVYDETGTTPNCFDEQSFQLTIIQSPIITAPENIVVENCDSYVLPTILGTGLSGNEAYYTGTGGTGTTYIAGDTILFDPTETYPITLYVYDETGTTPNCFDETSFQLSIFATPDISPPANTSESVCDTFTLPAILGTNLTGNEAYFTGSGGTGISYSAGDTINFDPTETYPITLYLYDEAGTQVTCFDEESFQLTISHSPSASVPTSNLTTCDEGNGIGTFDTSLLEDEILNGQDPNNYTITYTDSNNTIISFTNPFESETQTISAIVSNNNNISCTSQTISFTLTVDPTPIASVPTTVLEVCNNGNGTANFDLLSIEDEIIGTQNDATVSYHTSETDANLGTNSIITTPYAVTTQDVWARVENSFGCYAVVKIPLIVEDCIFIVPTGFSPNSNNPENQTFNLSFLKEKYPKYEVYIYNRYGNEVYKGDANTSDWNGKIQNEGDYLPAGTYFYGLKLNDDQDIQYRGWVYLQL